MRERDRRPSTRRRHRVGEAHQAGRRPPRDRSGVGAAQPRTGPRAARLSPAGELEDRRRRDAGRAAEPGRRVGHQGVRHRVLPGGLPTSDGDLRAGGGGEGQLARVRAAGSARSAHAACTSSRSVVAPTRCNATSSRSSVWACPDRPAEPAPTRRQRDAERQGHDDGLHPHRRAARAPGAGPPDPLAIG